ncbi:MAG: xylulokinase [Planctomycetota bacterium]|nr:xylulokinase [Planctomycetota bacterium]
MAHYLLAHDLGTSGNKATLYTLDGKLVASRTCPYDTHYFNGNWAEQSPQDWWKAICDSSKALLAAAKVSPADIAVVALSGQMMGCTIVDKQGHCLRPSILYCDQRAGTEAARILSRISLKNFYKIVGHRVSPSYSIEKLMWIRKNEPKLYAKTCKTLCAKDYINFLLTGTFATDFSDASGTNAFDLNTMQWSQKVIGIAGVDGGMFPEAKPSTEVLGTITSQAAQATGLKEGTPVAVGGGDGSCAGVGVGCIKPGTAYNYLGSSSWIALTVKKPIVDPQMRTMNWCHCVPGYLHPSGTMQTAGSSYSWLKNTLCDVEIEAAKTKNVSPYVLIDQAVKNTPVGANGILFLPYMLGERTPWWNPNARGAFIGLNLASSREDMLRAVMEGITMNLGIIVGIFRQHVPIKAITVIGGGAKSAVWRQMMADIYDCRVQSLNFLEEATSMGAAVIGGVAVGQFKSFDVIDRFIRVEHTAMPIPENRKRYRKIMPILEKSYRALVDVYEDLAAL